MSKSYIEFMKEITPDELYDRLIQYGLFSEALPPIFDCSTFFEFCKNNSFAFEDKEYDFAVFYSIRDINIPRTIGIPTPMAHELLCKALEENWPDILSYFENTTSNDAHKVSMIHIRKMKDKNSLFEMTYNNWRTDGTPEVDLSIGKNYLVKTDISQFYSSIYTHAIPWAILGKNQAKSNRTDEVWSNKLDKLVRNSKNGETHGILIGPLTSCIISEIILCKVDQELTSKWQYIRYIDDFSCYVATKDEADMFLLQLESLLRDLGMSLNYKKTQVIDLPCSTKPHWTRSIQDKLSSFRGNDHIVSYPEVCSLIDLCIELNKDNQCTSSIYYYCMKALRNYNLSYGAKLYATKMFNSLAINHPYLVPYLGEYIYDKYKGICDFSQYINLIFNTSIQKHFFGALAYSLYYAVKYESNIASFNINEVIKHGDCISLLCCLIYCRHFNLKKDIKTLKAYARDLLREKGVDKYWPFIYECLTQQDLKRDWKVLKKHKVSFLKKEYQSR